MIKIKDSVHLDVKKMTSQAKEWEKIFTIFVSHIDLTNELTAEYKECQQLNKQD